MFDFKEIFSQEFFFAIDRVRIHRSDWAVLIFGGALVILGVVKTVLKRYRANPVAKALLGRFAKLFLTIGFLEAFWFGLRYQEVVWFGTRIVPVLIFLVGIVWLGFILKYYFGIYRVEQANWQKEQQKLKYLKLQK